MIFGQISPKTQTSIGVSHDSSAKISVQTGFPSFIPGQIIWTTLYSLIVSGRIINGYAYDELWTFFLPC